MPSSEVEPSTVGYEREGGIVTLTLNRPRVRNAIDGGLQTALRARIEEVRMQRDVGVVVLTGAGSAFCAGGDINAMGERAEADPATIAETGWRRQQGLHDVLLELYGLEKVTIAAVNGPAMGLGCDLALCCDFVVAGPSARFAMSYIRRGLFPDGGGIHFLPRRVGLAKAKELIFSGREVGPEEALTLGIADQLATRTPMLDEVRAWAEQFVKRSPIAIALAKSALNQTFERSLQDAFDSGAAAQAICYTSEEHQRAVKDFLMGRSGRDPATQDVGASVEERREPK